VVPVPPPELVPPVDPEPPVEPMPPELPPVPVELFAGALMVRNLAWLMLLVTGSHMWYLPAASVTIRRAVLPAAMVGVRFGDIVSPMIARACFVVPLFTTMSVTLPAGSDVVVNVTRPSSTEIFSSLPAVREDPVA